VKEQPKLEGRHTQVVEELSARKRGQGFGSLNFKDDLVVDDHIKPLPGYVARFVCDVHRKLAHNGVAAIDELALESAGIDRLGESVAVIVVDRVERAKDRAFAVGL
jgi:hypothetical protein